MRGLNIACNLNSTVTSDAFYFTARTSSVVMCSSAYQDGQSSGEPGEVKKDISDGGGGDGSVSFRFNISQNTRKLNSIPRILYRTYRISGRI